MKTILKATAIILLVVIAILFVREYTARYTMRYCEVYDTEKYEGEIAIIDNKDDIWVWREDTNREVKVGDRCRLKMHTNHTEEIEDDYILEIVWED